LYDIIILEHSTIFHCDHMTMWSLLWHDHMTVCDCVTVILCLNPNFNNNRKKESESEIENKKRKNKVQCLQLWQSDIAEKLRKEFVFAISLLGTTIQDGSIKERSNMHITSFV